MCKNVGCSLRQWHRPVNVKDRVPTRNDASETDKVLAWDSNSKNWAPLFYYEVGSFDYSEYTFWMKQPPNPD